MPERRRNHPATLVDQIPFCRKANRYHVAVIEHMLLAVGSGSVTVAGHAQPLAVGDRQIAGVVQLKALRQGQRQLLDLAAVILDQDAAALATDDRNTLALLEARREFTPLGGVASLILCRVLALGDGAILVFQADQRAFLRPELAAPL